MNIIKIGWNNREYKAIPSYEGYYISNDGEIISTRKGPIHSMNPMSSTTGHQYILTNGNPRKLFVHRAVLMAWDRPPTNGEIARHLNDNPKDNRLDNLAWGTYQDNADDKVRNGRSPYGEKSGAHTLTENDVMKIRHRYSNGERSSKLSKEFGVSCNCIKQVVRGATWRHLPTVPIKVQPSCARITPISKEHKEKFLRGMRMYAASRRKERVIVECACGCGDKLETPDSRGRDRKYIHGHNNKRRC